MTAPAAPICSRADAEAADAADSLAAIRERFVLPAGVLYLDGNSLGALPANVPAVVSDAVTRQWGQDLITSWNVNDWWTLPTRLGERLGALVGAASGQVMCGESTTVQLYQAVTAASRVTPEGTARASVDGQVLLVDAGAFPTDRYVVDAVAEATGLTVRTAEPGAADFTDVAVVLFSAVDYRSGEFHDVAAVTVAAHAAGASMVWDLSHAVGAVPIDLDAIDADFAVGCTYKYLNGGPGAPAFIYIAARHQAVQALPLVGWHGHEDPFGLHEQFAAAVGIGQARLGTPPLLSMLALEAALDAWNGVELAAVRAKSLALTTLVIDFADRALSDYGVTVATPREPARRGSHVSLSLPRAYEVCQALIARGVIGDFRAPNFLRLGMTPLYLRYVDVWTAMEQLRDVLATDAWADPRFAARSTVT